MALRQPIPTFDPAGGLLCGQVKPLRRMAPPVSVGYRAGGSVDALIDAIEFNQSVLIDGAVGVGKSTVLPLKIAARLEKLVVHVVPTQFLAVELSDYLNRDAKVVSVATTLEDVWPAEGVVIVPASLLQAMFLSSGELALPECVVYHDESHRSDAWTYLLARQWGSIRGVLKYVNATATANPALIRKAEPAGVQRFEKLPADLMDSEWRVLANTGLPWEVSSIVGDIMIFEDDIDRVGRLVQDYNRAGLDVFRLHSRMKDTVFKAAKQSLAGPGLTVLIADSSFRDGHNFNLSAIIDPGVVVSTTVVDNDVRRVRRDAFQFEMYQGANRAARAKGQSCVVWQADRRYAASKMVLEEMEMEAVALVSRMLNVLPPVEVMDCVMAEGKVPRDLAQALASAVPLALLKDSQLIVPSETGYRRSSSPVVGEREQLKRVGLDFRHPGMSATLANKRDFDEVSASTAPSTQPSIARSAPTVSSVSTASSAGFEEWLLGSVLLNAEVGKYYYLRDVDMSVVACSAFPEGWKSVSTVYAPVYMRHSFSTLPDRERGVACAALLQRFNQLSCEHNASAAAASDVRLLVGTRARESVKVWLNGYMENCTRLQSEMRYLSDLLSSALDGFSSLEPLPERDMHDKEREMADGMVASFRQLRLVGDSVPDMVSSVDTSSYAAPAVAGMIEHMTLVSDKRYKEIGTVGKLSRVKAPAIMRWAGGGSVAGRRPDKRLS